MSLLMALVSVVVVAVVGVVVTSVVAFSIVVADVTGAVVVSSHRLTLTVGLIVLLHLPLCQAYRSHFTHAPTPTLDVVLVSTVITFSLVYDVLISILLILNRLFAGFFELLKLLIGGNQHIFFPLRPSLLFLVCLSCPSLL